MQLAVKTGSLEYRGILVFIPLAHERANLRRYLCITISRHHNFKTVFFFFQYSMDNLVHFNCIIISLYMNIEKNNIITFCLGSGTTIR